MSKLTLALVAGFSALLIGGCMDARIGKVDPLATPAYTGQERFEEISRNAEFEWKVMNDDIDHSIFMSRPVSSLTIWNIR